MFHLKYPQYFELRDCNTHHRWCLLHDIVYYYNGYRWRGTIYRLCDIFAWLREGYIKETGKIETPYVRP